MTNIKLFIFLILITPVFWWILLRVPTLVNTWKLAPASFSSQMNSMFSPDRLKFIQDLRFESEKHPGGKIYSRVFYSKPVLLLDDFFSYTSFLSPRIYFQAGDGENLSPKGVEPIPVLLFPLWIFGLIVLIEKLKLKPIFIWLGFGLLAYLVGQKNFAFTFPIILMNLYFIKIGFEQIKNKKLQKGILIGTLIYSLYLIGRVIWLG